MNNKKFLGIEFGSTRIKAVALDSEYKPVSSGDYTWASSFENGIWTYDVSKVWDGLKTALSQIQGREDVCYMGLSGMMHGYLVFDEDWNLLVPFRTWQNTITAPAAYELTELFNFNIPQRWSISHLYQAVLNGEEHVSRVAHITSLAGYVHYMLTGVNAVGIGEASGMFPVDTEKFCYDEKMAEKFNKLAEEKKIPWKLTEVLPKILVAGDNAGCLTKEGSEMIDGLLPEGIPFAPPEGDGGTGMIATNAVAPRTGNVSAGTSIFAMVVMEKPLENVYEEIDIITTPSGKNVAMVHGNNCTTDSNAWVSVLKESAMLLGADASDGDIYTKLYEKSLQGDADCGGVLVCNYLAGEVITHIENGRPLVVRRPDSKFTLANFFRSILYSTMATLKLGMDILEKENVKIDSMTGHGGLFKTPKVGQTYMSCVCSGAPITCMKTAGEGGPYGMALLAAYACDKNDGETLEEYLDNRVFKNAESVTVKADQSDIDGFNKYMEDYKKMLEVERTASEII